MRFTWVLMLTLVTIGCGYRGMYSMTNNGTVMQITQLTPNTANVSGPAFMLTVNGSGFTSNSVVYWNSLPLSTKFVMPQQLVAMVPAAQLAMPGMMQVFVFSNGMSSNPMSFTVN